MGLNDMVGRVQDAVIGRFLSADPTVPHPMNPQSYNPYSYTSNNPLTYVDPSGFDDDGPYTYLPPVIVTAPPEISGDIGLDTIYVSGDGLSIPSFSISPGSISTGSGSYPGSSGNSQSQSSSPPEVPPLPQVVARATRIPNDDGGFDAWLDEQIQSSWVPSFGLNSIASALLSALPTSPQSNQQPQPNQQQCTAAQQQAAQLAGALDNYSHLSGLFALGTGLAAAISGAGEGVTFGVDTPATISFGSATAFFATESAITGGAAAALNSFANGNTTALASFDVSSLTDTAVSGIAEKIPGVGSYAEVAGQLAGQVADVVNAARGACE